jgi:uncharacterized protein YdeI (YjbR/CyaY-like superfamily)
MMGGSPRGQCRIPDLRRPGSDAPMASWGTVARAKAAKATRRGDMPVMTFRDRDEWHAWLAAHHATSTGVWVRLAKIGSGVQSIAYDEAVEGALCYGWIDGQAKSVDDRYWMQRFTPRGKRSLWSKRNRERADALIAAGVMTPAGLAEIERAKADGRWDAAYSPPSRAVVPPDLEAALNRHVRAKRFFATLDSRNRFAILHRLETARKPETRARRLAQFVEMLKKKEKIYP